MPAPHRSGLRVAAGVTIPESDRPVVQVPVGGDLIHAPTGAVLLQFRRVAIEGTPVTAG